MVDSREEAPVQAFSEDGKEIFKDNVGVPRARREEWPQTGGVQE